MTLKEIYNSDEWNAWKDEQIDWWVNYESYNAENSIDEIANNNIIDHSSERPMYIRPSYGLSYVDCIYPNDEEYIAEHNWMYGNDSNLKAMIADASHFLNQIIGTEVSDVTFSAAMLYKYDLQSRLEMMRESNEYYEFTH